MNLFLKYRNYHPSPLLRAFQFFLLILIIIGVFLLMTQDLWVAKFTDYLIQKGW